MCDLKAYSAVSVGMICQDMELFLFRTRDQTINHYDGLTNANSTACDGCRHAREGRQTWEIQRTFGSEQGLHDMLLFRSNSDVKD